MPPLRIVKILNEPTRKGLARVKLATFQGGLLRHIIGVTTGMCALSVESYAVDSPYFYRVKKEDTLSEVLSRFGLTPIYPKNRSVNAALGISPPTFNHKNRIHLNEIVLLPMKNASEVLERNSSEVVNPVIVRALAAEIESSPSPIAAASPIAMSENHELATSALTLGIGVNYFRVDETDTTNHGSARIFSSASPRLDFGYALQWNDSTSIRMTGSVSHYTFTPFSTAVSYDSNSGLKSEFGLETAQEFFLRALAPTVLTADKVVIDGPSFRAKYALFNKKDAQIGSIGGYGLLLPTTTNSYSIANGTKFKLGMSYRRGIDLE